MTPRWPLLLVMGLAMLPLAAIPAAGLFANWSVTTVYLGTQITLLAILATILVAILDAVFSPRLSRISVSREAPLVLSVAGQNTVRVWFVNRNSGSLTIEFHDEHPQPADVRGLPFVIELPPRKERSKTYGVSVLQRGKNEFGFVYLRMKSRFGLWNLHSRRTCQKSVRVYPNLAAVHGVELLARQNRLTEAGHRLSRLRGRGTEFDRLRDYRREDEPRHIDWKATARNQRLISREYVVERNQNVIIVLDAGRGMCNAVDDVSHFDRALNAAVMLSYVALRQGDNVAAMVCSNRLQRWVPGVRGANGAQILIRQTFDVQPEFVASDYGLMAEELRRRFRKRSLVILLTHAMDDLHLSAISHHFRGLRNPHLVLTAFLRATPLQQRVSVVPGDDLEAFQAAAAAEMLLGLSLKLAELERSGVMVLDAIPENLSADMISRYLDIKARHLL